VPAGRNHHVLNRGGVLLELAVGRGDFQVVQRGQPLLQVTTTLRASRAEVWAVSAVVQFGWRPPHGPTSPARPAQVHGPTWRRAALVVVSYAEPIACFGCVRRRRRQ
jgi:hypothetical protein